jgi:IS5 family transposase
MSGGSDEEPSMRPKEPTGGDDLDLFRARLENIVDQRHPLVRLAALIDWSRFDEAFGALYSDGVGRPGLPTRLRVGLHLIKHMDALADEVLCARYLDSPYVQVFCGETYFQLVLHQHCSGVAAPPRRDADRRDRARRRNLRGLLG